MVAQPTWAAGKYARYTPKKSTATVYAVSKRELVDSTYKATKGATPALRDLVRDYKAKKASGAVVTQSGNEPYPTK